jgi:hypothetical protein
MTMANAEPSTPTAPGNLHTLFATRFTDESGKRVTECMFRTAGKPGYWVMSAIKLLKTTRLLSELSPEDVDDVKMWADRERKDILLSGGTLEDIEPEHRERFAAWLERQDISEAIAFMHR